VLVNVKIFISTHTHTFWSVFWQLGSIILFYCAFLALDLIPNSGLQGVLDVLLSYVTNYVILFLFMSGFILVDLGLNYINDVIQDQLEMKEREEEIELEKQIARERRHRS
jgi:hypothetical protein